MDIHVCKQCGSRFVYCRACVFRPIRYKDNGFCSKECYEASKNVVISAVEPEVIEEIVVAEEPKNIEEVIEDTNTINMEAEAEAVVSEEIPVIEEAAVVEPIIKKETNTYKKKKSKR